MTTDTNPIQHFWELIQGTDAWLQARCGLLTASEMDRVLTPKLKIAENAASKLHMFDLMAQRLTEHLEPSYLSRDMLRGEFEEDRARELYSKHHAPVKTCGFVTNCRHGFTLGCSPDGFVGDDGMIEIKSRLDKYQAQTIVLHAMNEEGPSCPEEYMLQIQTGLLVTERKWCDFISICGGMPLVVVRVLPDPTYRAAILEAAGKFEARLLECLATYSKFVEDSAELIVPERIDMEMVL